MEISKSQKAVYVVISVLLAVVLWLYVDNTDANERDIRLDNIPVTFVGANEELAERGLMLVSGADAEIDLRLEGRRQVIYKLNRSNIKVEVDVRGISSKGKHTLDYTVVYPDNVPPNSISVVSASMYNVTVEVGELYTKTIDVVADVNGDVPDGYMVHECIVSPETITISGRPEEVENADHALVQVTLNNTTSSYSEYKNYSLVDAEGNAITDSDLRFSADKVRVEVPVVTLKELPLTVNFTESGGSALKNIDYRITPPTITISGEESTISKLESIPVALIQLDQVMGDDVLEYEIPIPGGCSNESGTDVAKVKIGFKENIQTETYECMNISFVNQPEHYEATAITQSLDVTLRGKRTDLAKVSAQNIRVVVDLAGITSASGTYTAKAKVFVDGSTEVGAIGAYQVGYRLKKI